MLAKAERGEDGLNDKKEKGLDDGSFSFSGNSWISSFLKCSILIKSLNTHKTVSF
jgi:hypothetical protein